MKYLADLFWRLLAYLMPGGGDWMPSDDMDSLPEPPKQDLPPGLNNGPDDD